MGTVCVNVDDHSRPCGYLKNTTRKGRGGRMSKLSGSSYTQSAGGKNVLKALKEEGKVKLLGSNPKNFIWQLTPGPEQPTFDEVR